MYVINRIIKVRIFVCATAIIVLVLSGCKTEEIVVGTVGGVGLTTLIGGRIPSDEIRQIYYIGIFDPQEQLPRSLYRITIHGQASFISGTKFASGWVPAEAVDSLSTQMKFDKDKGVIKYTKGENVEMEALETGRRLVLFGPEGFREAPGAHRLVIIMGSSPEKYFQAVEEALGVISAATAEQVSIPEKKRQEILKELMETADRQADLSRMKSEFIEDLYENRKE